MALHHIFPSGTAPYYLHFSKAPISAVHHVFSILRAPGGHLTTICCTLDHSSGSFSIFFFHHRDTKMIFSGYYLDMCVAGAEAWADRLRLTECGPAKCCQEVNVVIVLDCAGHIAASLLVFWSYTDKCKNTEKNQILRETEGKCKERQTGILIRTQDSDTDSLTTGLKYKLK